MNSEKYLFQLYLNDEITEVELKQLLLISAYESESEPFYQDDLITLFEGNCLDLITTVKDKSIKLICTDPPYGVGTSSNGEKANYYDNQS